ncbi:YihY/virulence factor BrkB family protein [Paracoccus hibiscisoli]|uniref:YihY/virulence factor BrkB family protein n=1 Tax=Paracoccus hibiscisoli TaxID=2023261 RepID=A0A4U0QEG7_9RHOB|nr:YihY/virulence factor BrkB family protein [Paracoccus hibiscisoli]TJZ79885.1 YihY/virulence factor BrkB family protein [Paracoccus hibiscisoli]
MAQNNLDGGSSSPGTSTPARFTLSEWKEILLRVKSEIATDHISVVSAGIAFYALLSIFPAIAALISIAGLVLDPADIASQLGTAVAMLPESAGAILQEQVVKVTEGDETGTGLVALFGIAIALYGAMKGVLTLMEGLNIAYDEEETRGLVKQYLTAFVITLCAIVGLAAGIAVLIVLPAVIAFMSFPPVVETVANWLRWPLMGVLTMLALAGMYRFGPSRADPKWRWVSVGAIVATLLWVLGTGAFSLYVQNFDDYTETYGALGGVIILLTWMWLSAFIVLSGAELNAEIEQQTSEDTTTGAPEPMGERDAVKADTPPPGKSEQPLRNKRSGDRDINTSNASSGTSPTSPGADLTLALILAGNGVWKLIRRGSRRDKG